MGTTRGAVASLAMLATLLMQAGCARTPTEQQLRDELAALQASVEARDASTLEATLASDFVGQDGLDREGARRLARLMFLRHRDIGATLGPLRIRIHDRHATVGFAAALTGSAGGILPEVGGVHDVETAWRMEDGGWRLISARWTPRP